MARPRVTIEEPCVHGIHDRHPVDDVTEWSTARTWCPGGSRRVLDPDDLEPVVRLSTFPGTFTFAVPGEEPDAYLISADALGGTLTLQPLPR